MYLQIVDQLKDDTRPLVSLNKEQINSLCDQTRKALSRHDKEHLSMFLCILDNTRTMDEKLDELALDILLNENLEELTAVALSPIGRHIIEYRQMAGKMLPTPLFSKLKELISHPDSEVKFWALRLADQMGNKAMILRKEIISQKPKFWQLLNKNNRMIRVLIEMMERTLRLNLSMKDKIKLIVEDFYQKAQSDFMIGYHFRKVDMKEHIPRIISFWRIQILNEKITVNPVFNLFSAHIPLRIKKGELGRFVTLFHLTLNEFIERYPQDEEFAQKWELKLLFFKKKFLTFKNFFDK